MPVHAYSVLKGMPRSGALSPNARPHYLIELDAGGVSYQIAVNVESDVGTGTSAEVLYKLDENWTPPNEDALHGLAMGVTSLAGLDRDPAVDYVRSRVGGQPLVTREQLTALPLPGRTDAANLMNAVVSFLNRAVADRQGVVYAFGALYTGGNGIHDIHMNQGNPAGNHAGDNGVWQDGLLVFEMPIAPEGQGRWAAVFIAFMEQVWQTDGQGNAAG